MSQTELQVPLLYLLLNFLQVLKDALTPYGEMLTVDRSELLPVAQSLVIALDMDIIAKPGT